ncbi:hypothetical protein [Conchiformibius steedae]|uniref:PylC N-terminal domain-containing protein n=1 Tax=Conchiformibius steedae TaxID=153493 RepID=A0A3P2ACE1_9NEIS|nr:hypothetical protein [Conchiformibius steedae]RRD91303.1 hypothetical protein EII21_02645 [Conchiformibius steedae]
MNVLFTCAGRRNYLINYCKEILKDGGIVFASDMGTAPSMVDADISFIVPSIYDKNYLDTIEYIVIENNIQAIISLNDLELPILAKNKTRFEKLNVRVLVSDEAVIDLCFDKMKTHDFLKDLGLKSPKTFTNL